MKIYFAHSFEGTHPARPLASGGPSLTRFLERMQLADIEVVDPAYAHTTLGHAAERFEYCLREIDSSDVFLVEATERLGVGVGAEMMYAHMNRLRVFVVCPSKSYYKLPTSGGEVVAHAFVLGLSTKIFDSLEECAAELERLGH